MENLTSGGKQQVHDKLVNYPRADGSVLREDKVESDSTWCWGSSPKVICCLQERQDQAEAARLDGLPQRR